MLFDPLPKSTIGDIASNLACLQRRSKVKSRVVLKELGELPVEAEKTSISGHVAHSAPEPGAKESDAPHHV